MASLESPLLKVMPTPPASAESPMSPPPEAATPIRPDAPGTPAPDAPPTAPAGSPSLTVLSSEGPKPDAVAPPPPALTGSFDAMLRRRLSATLPPELQEELAVLLVLRDDAATALGAEAARQVERGILALLATEPNLVFARAIRKRLASRVADKTQPLRLSALLKTDSPPLQVVLGLGLMLLCAVPLVVYFHVKLESSDTALFQMPLRLLVMTMLGGVLGSVASILVRIRDFDQAQGTTPASLVLLGFSKPVVGAAFALFAMSVLRAGLLPIQVPAEGSGGSAFFLALSFLSGFSERFAQDIVTRITDQFDANGASQKEKEPEVSPSPPSSPS